MTVSSVILSILWLVIIPFACGIGITIRSGKTAWSWFFGQLLLWSAFLPISLYAVLKQKDMIFVRNAYLPAAGVILVISIALLIIWAVKNRAKAAGKISGETKEANETVGGTIEQTGTGERSKRTGFEIAVIVAVFALLAVQIVLLIVLAYMEVDDSYYVSEATSSVTADRFYFKIPYTGLTTEIDTRHGLAPFPIWLGFISFATGVKTVTLAHIILPVIHTVFTYGVYALFGAELLGENKKRYLPVFMLFTELITLFSFYSYMTPEKFFLTRIREGKATIASLIIPGIIMTVYLILRALSEDKKIDFRLYLLLFALNISGCLCSTLGALICVLPIGICAVLGIFVFKKFKHVIPMLLTCAPCVFMALLYLHY
ncbi:MAG: hypothetical protein IKR35_06385 [Lachnospiraceae bacterium]|nr:hypothetical protein [Lachnospiraceae bacterium]